MPIGTYSELQTAISGWLHRSDLATKAPDFIALAESRLNRLLRLRTMESNEAMTASAGSRSVALPAGFIDPLALWLELASGRSELRFYHPSVLPVTTSTGVPTCWTVDGANLAFERPVDQAYSLTLRMLKAFSLSDAQPTNWLLTNHPDLYLYGALIESAPYIRDDARIALWQERFDRAFAEVQAKEHRSQSLATLSTDVAMTGRNHNRTSNTFLIG